jgi:hypothetical protein
MYSELGAGVDDLRVQGASCPDIVVVMEQRISFVTFGVEDLAQSRVFYEALGWHGQETEETVFFQAGGVVLVLWGREKLAADSGVENSDPNAFDGIVLAHNVRSTQEVDQLIAIAEQAGATVTRRPSETFYGGYAGCFVDLDGHIWEVAFNPGFAIDPDGSMVIPNFGVK